MATFAETMLSKYETLLQASAGLDTISVDGQSERYADVEAKYRYWKRDVARPKSGPVPGEKSTRPQAASINSPSRVARGDLGGFC